MRSRLLTPVANLQSNEDDYNRAHRSRRKKQFILNHWILLRMFFPGKPPGPGRSDFFSLTVCTYTLPSSHISIHVRKSMTGKMYGISC